MWLWLSLETQGEKTLSYSLIWEVFFSTLLLIRANSRSAKAAIPFYSDEFWMLVAVDYIFHLEIPRHRYLPLMLPAMSLLTHFSEWKRQHLDDSFSCTSCIWLPLLKLNSILVSKVFGIFITGSLSKWSHILMQNHFTGITFYGNLVRLLNLEVFIIPGQLY